MIKTSWVGGSYEAATATTRSGRRHGESAGDIRTALQSEPGLEAIDISDRVGRNPQAVRKMLRRMLMLGDVYFTTSVERRSGCAVTIKHWFVSAPASKI